MTNSRNTQIKNEYSSSAVVQKTFNNNREVQQNIKCIILEDSIH